MVSVTFSDLQSQFLVLPKGPSFIEYRDFQYAYEVLERHTAAFTAFTEDTVWMALREDSLSFVVLRTILGMTPPEWTDVARSERASDISQGYARALDVRCRRERGLFDRLTRSRRGKALDRAEALISVATQVIRQGAPAGAADTAHRLAKVDTAEGLTSVQHVAAHHVPYAVLLYERYLGRPFASHRDSVSELIGDVMENAIEERLTRARISFRKTKRAERVPGYDQAPDFFVPDEFNPAVLIEAKITGDDGTARDKATRIVHLAELRDERLRQGRPGFEVVAAIDGRGFGVRREDMRRILLRTEGKVFTLATLDQLIPHTRLRGFLPMQPSGA
ncbi:MAG: hypothetical protein HY331_18785 [Chloroflexi bacterium]|nr:hypothetical protein [Chloroflexota bacterium]